MIWSLRLWVLLCGLAAVGVALASIFVGARRVGVVPMPSSVGLRHLITRILRDRNGPGSVTDLGAGWGGLARRLASEFPHRSVVAVEHGFVPVIVSRLLSPRPVFRNLHHVRSDFNTMPLKPNSTYVCYLSGTAMKELRKSYERDMPENGVLVSAVFAMPGWTPSEIHTAPDIYRSPVYVYEY